MTQSELFEPVPLSLEDLLGPASVAALATASAVVTGRSEGELLALARRRVECLPEAFQRRQRALLARVGQQVMSPVSGSPAGATTRAFAEASQLGRAPVAAFGIFRVGEDGRLYFASKSEHYQCPLGHALPGYRLLDLARELGVPNATHNGTRGVAVRRLERELVRVANGLPEGDEAALERALGDGSGALNRVLNLQTGSLAAEAAVKLMLSRFYRVEADQPAPPLEGRVPVFLAIGDLEGGIQANYHGTALITQVLRGMWPELRARCRDAGILEVAAVRPDDLDGLEDAFRRWMRPPYRLAGFAHELVLMNYGGYRVGERFIRRAYELCAEHDVPTLADEIQTGLWAPRLLLYLDYGLEPTFVAVGKGFPGGEYAGSRLIFRDAMDRLPQFGALVTNGQEELAALAYLVTMRWAWANRARTAALGEAYQQGLRELVARHPRLLREIQGHGHLASLYFQELAPAKTFVDAMVARGFDISVQTYKASCPPGALTKLPLTADREAIDCFLAACAAALADVEGRP